VDTLRKITKVLTETQTEHNLDRCDRRQVAQNSVPGSTLSEVHLLSCGAWNPRLRFVDLGSSWRWLVSFTPAEGALRSRRIGGWTAWTGGKSCLDRGSKPDSAVSKALTTAYRRAGHGSYNTIIACACACAYDTRHQVAAATALRALEAHSSRAVSVLHTAPGFWHARLSCSTSTTCACTICKRQRKEVAYSLQPSEEAADGLTGRLTA
jgi:hypothetical protein